jgi:hypothetical protein
MLLTAEVMEELLSVVLAKLEHTPKSFKAAWCIP